MRRKIIPYNPNLKLVARDLRNNSTLAQILLWLQLKGKTMHGYDFHRQKPIDNYILDFFCHELMLGIEVGDCPDNNDLAQKNRQLRLESLGLTMFHFTDDQVLNDITNVLSVIDNYIREFEKHTPSPSQEGRSPHLNS